MSGGLPDQEELMEADIALARQNNAAQPPIAEAMEHGNDNENEDDIEDVYTPQPPTNNDNQSLDSRASSRVEDTDFQINIRPFEMDHICTDYKHWVLVNRLQFVADHCPPLRKECLIEIMNCCKSASWCVSRYVSAHALLESQYRGDPAIPKFDQGWVDKMTQASAARLESLQQEVKRQKDEGVKESTRRAMEELFAHYINVGALQDALRLYNKGMRDYCSQFKHVMNMYVEWVEVAVMADEWSKVEPLISQAERAILDAQESDAAVAGMNRARSFPAGSTRTNKKLMDNAKAQLTAVCGLSRLHSGRFLDAAEKFTSIVLDDLPVGWLLNCPNVACYGTYCALATFSRNDIKKKLLSGDSPFRRYLECDPSMMEALNSFVRSDFNRLYQILDRLLPVHQLDLFLSPHMTALSELIRERAILQYLAPFCRANLAHMAREFSLPETELEDRLVNLVERGLLCCRIDSVNGFVDISKPPVDDRQIAYKKILALSKKLEARVNSTIFKSLLGEGRIYIASPGAEYRMTKKSRPAREHVQYKFGRSLRMSAGAPDPEYEDVDGNAVPDRHSRAGSLTPHDSSI